jgi:hypothetical protein
LIQVKLLRHLNVILPGMDAFKLNTSVPKLR